MYFNGEVLSKDLARRSMLILPNVRFINVYSISECHEVSAIDVSMMQLGDKPVRVCPVGYPSPLSPLYILDDNLQQSQRRRQRRIVCVWAFTCS